MFSHKRAYLLTQWGLRIETCNFVSKPRFSWMMIPIQQHLEWLNYSKWLKFKMTAQWDRVMHNNVHNFRCNENRKMYLVSEPIGFNVWCIKLNHRVIWVFKIKNKNQNWSPNRDTISTKPLHKWRWDKNGCLNLYTRQKNNLQYDINTQHMTSLRIYMASTTLVMANSCQWITNYTIFFQDGCDGGHLRYRTASKNNIVLAINVINPDK